LKESFHSASNGLETDGDVSCDVLLGISRTISRSEHNKTELLSPAGFLWNWSVFLGPPPSSVNWTEKQTSVLSDPLKSEGW
jgi:hypothetical protein